MTTPFGGELLFRGVVFRLLEAVLGSWVALVLSSAWLGYVYGPMLAAPYILTGRLWMGTGLHLAWNYTMGKVYSGPVSGGESMTGLFRITYRGPDLLTGGSAGIEGSLIAILVALALTLVLLILAVRRGPIVPLSWQRRRGTYTPAST